MLFKQKFKAILMSSIIKLVRLHNLSLSFNKSNLTYFANSSGILVKSKTTSKETTHSFLFNVIEFKN